MGEFILPLQPNISSLHCRLGHVCSSSGCRRIPSPGYGQETPWVALSSPWPPAMPWVGMVTECPHCQQPTASSPQCCVGSWRCCTAAVLPAPCATGSDAALQGWSGFPGLNSADWPGAPRSPPSLPSLLQHPQRLDSLVPHGREEPGYKKKLSWTWGL